MAEYIERGRLKEAISADCQHLFSFDTSFYDMVMIDIDEVPAEDVAPVVHGRWEVDEFGRCCSACKEYIPDDFAPSEYCPNCGAKMDVKED